MSGYGWIDAYLLSHNFLEDPPVFGVYFYIDGEQDAVKNLSQDVENKELLAFISILRSQYVFVQWDDNHYLERLYGYTFL